MMSDSRPISAILGRHTVRCCVKPGDNRQIVINFSPRCIKPTHYSLKHYSSWDTEALRSWRFEGSLDGGSSYVQLKVHEWDTSFNGKGSTKTWTVDSDVMHRFLFAI